MLRRSELRWSFTACGLQDTNRPNYVNTAKGTFRNMLQLVQSNKQQRKQGKQEIVNCVN